MTTSLILGLVWLALAQATGLLRPPAHRRRAAVALTIGGIPLLGWVTTEAGPYVGLTLLAAGALSLRWPLAGMLRGRRAGWHEPVGQEMHLRFWRALRHDAADGAVADHRQGRA